MKWVTAFVIGAVISIIFISMIPVMGEMEWQEYLTIFTIPFLLITCFLAVVIKAIVFGFTKLTALKIDREPQLQLAEKEISEATYNLAKKVEKSKKVIPRFNKKITYKFSNGDKWIISLVIGIIIFLFLTIPPLIRGYLEDYRDAFIYFFPIMFLMITIPATLAIRLFLWLIDRMRQVFMHFKLFLL